MTAFDKLLQAIDRDIAWHRRELRETADVIRRMVIGIIKRVDAGDYRPSSTGELQSTGQRLELLTARLAGMEDVRQTVVAYGAEQEKEPAK